MTGFQTDRWNLALMIAGGGFFSLIVLLDLAAGVQIPFPWSLLMLVSCAAMGAAVARHIVFTGPKARMYDLADTESAAGTEEEKAP